MKYILSILDGMEKGIDITLENDTIYSIGTQDDSDFYIRKKDEHFLVFCRVLNETTIEWWAQKKVSVVCNGNEFILGLNKVEVAINEVFKVGGRQFGVFSGLTAVEEVRNAMVPEKEQSELSSVPVEHVSEPESKITDDEVSSIHEIASEEPISVESLVDEPLALDLPEHTISEERAQLNVAPIAVDTKVVEAAKQNFSSKNRKKTEPLKTEASVEKKQSKIFQALKLAPFVVGIIILIGYAFMNRSGSQGSSAPVSPKVQQEKERKQNMSQEDTVEEIDQMLSDQSVDSTVNDLARSKEPQFIASGSEYNIDGWQRIKPVEVNDEHALESLRKKVNDGTVQPIQAAEVLFPDEKMMTLIKDMLDTAGAEGIDVRFDRGNYDVFGYVMDDEKWQRIHKILTFDLDLTKVQFSVETSVTLIKKFEALLKKFNLSSYVVLSLGSKGQIFAKTYYPPALEGLWYTIKSRFEKKYGQYTSVKEYRAHIGWINVVKVSFDQPSYVLLADGRRLVEGSIWGGSSVLDKIYADSIRVTSGSTQARYYVINKSRALVDVDLSDR